MEYNKTSLDTICASLAYAMGVEAPECSAKKNDILASYLDEKLKGKKADRIFMYNPDALGQWIYEKYKVFDKAQNDVSLEEDFYVCTQADKFDFVLRLKNDENGISYMEKVII